MRTAHGYGRLVGFSDGVVAIAITLLILPLVDAASDYDGSVGTFVVEHLGKLLLFLLSFAVIGNFWVVHHQMYEKLTDYTRGLLWLNLLWLMSIVFLPFPTALVANAAESPTTHILYIGTMVVTTAAGLAQQIVIVRHPEIQAEEVRGRLEVLTYASTVVIMVIALVIALAIPAIGLWSLLLLFAATPAEHAVRRLRLKGAAQ